MTLEEDRIAEYEARLAAKDEVIAMQRASPLMQERDALTRRVVELEHKLGISTRQGKPYR